MYFGAHTEVNLRIQCCNFALSLYFARPQTLRFVGPQTWRFDGHRTLRFVGPETLRFVGPETEGGVCTTEIDYRPLSHFLHVNR